MSFDMLSKLTNLIGLTIHGLMLMKCFHSLLFKIFKIEWGYATLICV